MSRALDAVAIATTVFHLLALALAGIWIAPGTMAGDAAARAAYLAPRPLGWTIGWWLWIASAVTLVAWIALVAERRPSSWTRLAVPVSIGAAAIDLSADALQIALRPALASEGPTPLFQAVATALDVVGFVPANGLYSVAVLLATIGVARAGAPRVVTLLGLLTFLAGFALAAAGFTLQPRALQTTAGLTMVAFVGWTLTLWWSVRERAR